MRFQSTYDAGHEAARRHIDQAQAFSQEIGGTDADVKQYFFSLRGYALEQILQEYGSKYGYEAECYARKTMPKWRSGRTKMSGLVAQRLFSFLPPRMPLEKKYELAENVWNHFGPSSSHSYTVGPEADVATVALTVARRLDQEVTEYRLPGNVQRRFEWLAAGDVKVKEQLLNHFRQFYKRVALEKVREELPILQRQVREHSDVTARARSVIRVHKHEVAIWIERGSGAEIRQGSPVKKKGRGGAGGMGWLWLLLALGILGWILSQ